MATRKPRVPRTGKRQPASSEESVAKSPRTEAATKSGSSARPSPATTSAKSTVASKTDSRPSTKDSRPSNRPGASAPKLTAKAAAQPEPSRFFSGRLLALIGVVILVAIIVAPSLNTFMQQRSDIAALKADIAQKQAESEALKKDVSKLGDPAYIKQQARDRVNMVMPGETGYWVYGGEGAPAQPNQTPTTANPDGLPWLDGLWKSIVRAGTE